MTTTVATVTSARVQSPFRVSFASVELPAPSHAEVLLDVLGCGICGYDMECAASLAPEPQPFGHEISGVVREVGAGVTHVKPGDQVALLSSTFCGVCDLCLNGRVDLCNKGAGFWGRPAMGFSDAMLAPAGVVAPSPNIDPLAAMLAEPCGVALDMIKTAEIGLTDRVLVVGTGPIGLMALAMARRVTTGTLVAANRSTGKLAVATRLGADAVACTADTPLEELGKAHGGFDRILVTAPPDVIPACVTAAAYGGYIVFIGSNFVTDGDITLNTHALHFGKKQLRSSFASPALYFPEALHLLRTGVVPPAEIISHRFPLSQLPEAIRVVREERATACKVAVIPDARFTG
jgi:L-iditol 2-dehydrogenase